MSEYAPIVKHESTFFQILARDLKLGGKKNLTKYIVAFCFICLVCIMAHKKAINNIRLGDISQMPQVLDYIVYIFGGIPPFDENSKNIFQIPYIWMAIQLLIASSVCLYPIKDLYSQGVTTLVQYGSRMQWWLSKCIWSLCQVIIIYIILFLGIAVSMFVFGATEFTYNPIVSKEICGIVLKQSGGIIGTVIIMSVFYSAMVTMVQINMSLVTGPVYSFILVVAYDILSSYLLHPALLGNMSMLCRLDKYNVPGINGNIAIIITICVIIASLLIGLIYFKRHDVLGDINS